MVVSTTTPNAIRIQQLHISLLGDTHVQYSLMHSINEINLHAYMGQINSIYIASYEIAQL